MKRPRKVHIKQSILWQLVFVGMVIAAASYGLHNALVNLEARGISRGFEFLKVTAGFEVVQALISFGEGSTYLRAFLVGLLNTVYVSVLAIVGSLILGFLVGFARFFAHPLSRGLAKMWIGGIRNIPLLLQIFFIYFAVLQSLPEPRDSLQFGNLIFLNNRGVFFPWIVNGEWVRPVLEGFDFVGGNVVIPELIALALGLTCYTSAFVGELVYASLKSVDKGLWEASRSLGLSHFQALRLVILPESLKVLIPPLTNQFLNVFKNSSLAAAIGYPDLVAVFAGTVLNQTGQAMEVISITMMVYLLISLLISIAMNYFNSRLARVRRHV
ncbi:MAG: ABC transporter permease subunit [Pseudomonadota bacterium]